MSENNYEIFKNKWADYFKEIIKKDISYFDYEYGFDVLKFRTFLRLNNKQFPKQYLQERFGKKAVIMLQELITKEEYKRKIVV